MKMCEDYDSKSIQRTSTTLVFFTTNTSHLKEKCRFLLFHHRWYIVDPGYHLNMMMLSMYFIGPWIVVSVKDAGPYDPS